MIYQETREEVVDSMRKDADALREEDGPKQLRRMQLDHAAMLIGYANRFEAAMRRQDDDAYMQRLEDHRAFLTKESHTIGDLEDWYIHSVMSDDKPVWTMEHLEELERDFWLIAKPMAERGV